MIKLEIPSVDMRTMNKRDGTGSFSLQAAYAHTIGKDGKPKPYPESFDIFVPTDPTSGQPKPYAKGFYTIDPNSFYVNKGRLDMFLRLVPIRAASSSA